MREQGEILNGPERLTGWEKRREEFDRKMIELRKKNAKQMKRHRRWATLESILPF